MTQRIYIDTSVIGGCLDAEFAAASNALFDEFRAGLKIPVVSDLTLRELEDAPDEVKKVLSLLPDGLVEDVFLDDEAILLANAYIAHGAVAEKHLVDCQHIAIATRERLDVLVSWNFQHIVNLDRIRKFNAVNLLQGYQPLEIRSPWEVLYGKEI
jgi:hypothetical protein